MSLIRFGRNTANATPTPSDLWLPVFGGEVIAAFREVNYLPELVYKKTITSGTTAKFPATWKMGSEYHEAGTELLGLQTELREYSISVDDRPIVSHFEVDDIDVAMSHFETRSEFSQQAGFALAKRDSQNVARLLIQASRTTQGNATSFPGGGIDGNGTAIVAGALGTENAAGALAVLTAIQQAVTRFDQLDVPFNDRYCLVRPGMYYQLRLLGTLTSAAAGPLPVMGHSDIDSVNPRVQEMTDKLQPLQYLGVSIIRTNDLPSTNESSVGLPTKYAGNYATTVGVIFQKTAIAHLTLLGVQVETERQVRRQVDFSVVKMLTGGGALRPYCAIELASS